MKIWSIYWAPVNCGATEGYNWTSTTGTDLDYHFGYVINLDFSSSSVSNDRTFVA